MTVSTYPTASCLTQSETGIVVQMAAHLFRTLCPRISTTIFLKTLMNFKARKEKGLMTNNFSFRQTWGTLQLQSLIPSLPAQKAQLHQSAAK
jgi:hypothetical protein